MHVVVPVVVFLVSSGCWSRVRHEDPLRHSVPISFTDASRRPTMVSPPYCGRGAAARSLMTPVPIASTWSAAP